MASAQKRASLRKMLGKADSPYIVLLMRLIETQSKETIVNYCLDYAQAHKLPIYDRLCENDARPRAALLAARDWMDGTLKLPAARRLILDCHAAAREAESMPVAQAAARAIGQAASSIHVPTHSLGLAFYGAAAIAYDRVGLDQSPAVYDQIAGEVCGQMAQALRAVSVPNEPHPAKINWRC